MGRKAARGDLGPGPRPARDDAARWPRMGHSSYCGRYGTAPDTAGRARHTVTASEGDPISSVPTATQPPSPTAPRKIRIYLLDDHEMVRRGLKDLFESADDFEVVGESGLAKDAEARIPALRPDVVILDGRLPDGTGVDVCRSVRSVDPSIRAVILTSYDDDEALFSAIMAGAAGYLLKQIVGADFLEAVRQVADGQSLLDPAVTQRVLDRLRHKGTQGPDELRSLTSQERLVLDLIAEGLTNRQIGERLFLAEKTVKNYVTNVLAKLGMQRRTQAAVFVSKLLQSP